MWISSLKISDTTNAKFLQPIFFHSVKKISDKKGVQFEYPFVTV